MKKRKSSPSGELFPFISSVAMLPAAIAAPQPKVLNLTSEMVKIL